MEIKMDDETRTKIEETVLEILKNSNMDETTEYKIRKSASEKLGMDLSESTRKKFVREVVELYLKEQQDKAEKEEDEAVEAEEEEEEEEETSRKKGGKEYDDEGGLIICRISVFKNAEFTNKLCGRMGSYDDAWLHDMKVQLGLLSDRRRVTISEFKGKTLISIREYYKKDGKELPTAKGISLSAEQWASFSKNVPAIEKAIKKMESR